MSPLWDTNVLSELARREPNAGVLRWAEGVSRISLSAVVLEEVRFGLAWRPNPRVRQWLDAFIDTHCAVLPVTEAIARRSGELRGQLRAKGQVRAQADMLIAATALVHDLTLVTRNSADFEGCGIALLNPFS